MATRAQLEAMAEDVATRTVKRTLETLGIEVNDPLKAQADFATMREVIGYARSPEFRKDLEHARKSRQMFEAAVSKTGVVVLATFVAGTLTAMWLGFLAMIRRPV